MERRKHNGQSLDGIGDEMDRTKVASVGSASQSLRTVIPLWIAKLLRIHKGTIVEWELIKGDDAYAAQLKVVEEE